MSQAGEAIRGRIKHLVADKGFGFIERLDGGADVFMHRSALARGCRFEELTVGTPVSARVIPSDKPDKGPRAVDGSVELQ